MANELTSETLNTNHASYTYGMLDLLMIDTVVGVNLKLSFTMYSFILQHKMLQIEQELSIFFTICDTIYLNGQQISNWKLSVDTCIG